jgi:hypothetical protein
VQDLEAVALSVGKHKEVSRTGVLPEIVGDDIVEAVEAFAHIYRLERHENAVAGPAEIIVGRILKEAPRG